MIDDSIRRSDVIDKLMHIIPYKRYHNGEYISLLNKKECLSAIKAIPSADRPQGEWIDNGWHGDWQFETDGRGNCWKEFECSNCNCRVKYITPFCPQCGAKMKGENDANR